MPQLHLSKQELATIILIVLSLPLLFLIKQQLNNLCKLKQIYQHFICNIIIIILNAIIMAHFSIQFIIVVTHSLSQLMEAASFDVATATIINIVSTTLQATTPQLTSDSFQSSNIAAIKLDIQVDSNNNLTNFIFRFVFVNNQNKLEH